MVDETADTLAWINAVAPNYTSYHCILHCHALGRGKTVSLKNVLLRAVKILIFKNLDPRVLVFLKFCVMKWELHIKPFCWILEYSCLEEKHTWNYLESKDELASFFMERYFSFKEQLTNYSYLGSPLAVQWLGLSAFTAQGLGSVPCWGTKTLQAAWRGPKKQKQKQTNYVYSGLAIWQIFSQK